MEIRIDSDTPDNASLASTTGKLRDYVRWDPLILVNLNLGKPTKGIFAALPMATCINDWNKGK